MREEIERFARNVKRLRRRRNDEKLMRARKRLVRYAPPGVREGPFWEALDLFDHAVIDRRQDGSLARYVLACELLASATELLLRPEGAS